MKKIKIITDSTWDLPMDIAIKNDIDVIPLMLSIDGVDYYDGVDINFNVMMEKIEKCGELPVTSQINPQRFYDIFKPYLDEDYKIIMLPLSQKMSGTYQSAMIAKDMLETDNIEVIDTNNVTSGLGVLVLEAVKLKNQGRSLKEIKEAIDILKTKVKSTLLFDSLDNLIKGGRLSKAAGIVGSVLNIKLILEVKDGEMNVKGKVRGMKKAVKTLIEDFESSTLKENSEVILLSSGANVEAYNMLRDDLDNKGISYIEAKAGCVVGTHAGKGACGLFFIEK